MPTEPDAGPSASVCAVVVTHRAEPDTLRACLVATASQVDAVVVIDNEPGDLVVPEGVTLLPQRFNTGLGAAQNVGLAWARARGHTHVLLLDQDSIPKPGMVAALLAAGRDLDRASVRVGALGPCYRDTQDPQDAPFVRIGFPFSRQVRCDTFDRIVACDFVIGSGMLLALDVVTDVGPMDADLFIDNVDLDWCFRARGLGYGVYGVCGARMDHQLGEGRRWRLPGRRGMVVHGPDRLYFTTRNRLAMYRRTYTPRLWIAQDVPRLLLRLLVYVALLPPRRLHVRVLVRALRDGALGRLGPGPAGAP